MAREVRVNRADYDEALDWVNKYRLAHGKGLIYELPSGNARRSDSCPLACATGRKIDSFTPMPAGARRLYNAVDAPSRVGERVKPVRA
jgi:hypothetical protein